MTHGWVNIGTNLDTKKFDSQIQDLENKISSTEKEQSILTEEINETENALKRVNEEYSKMEAELNEIDNKIRELKAIGADKGAITVGMSKEQQENLMNYGELIRRQEELNVLIAKPEKEINDTNNKLDKQNLKYQSINDKITAYKNKLALVDLKTHSNGLDNVGNKLSGIIKKVGKWALAVFGIRSAYMMVLRAMSTLSQHNEQMKTDMEYMRYAIATTLQPVIEWLVNALFTVLQYVNYIANAWFGVNLFAKATADNFRGARKEAQELKKTTQGFDEMNIAGTTSGGAGGVGVPSMDLSKMDFEVPEWLKWIGDNKDKVLKFFKELLVIIGGAKLLQLLGIPRAISGIFKEILKQGELTSAMFLKGFGVLTIVAGIILLITSLKDLIFEWEDLDTKQKAIKIGLAILGTAFIALGYAIATGLSVATLGIGALIAIIVAVVIAIGTLIAKLVTEKKAIKDVEEAVKDLKEAKSEYVDANDAYISAVEESEEANKKLLEVEKELKISGSELYNQVKNGTLDYKDMTAEQREVYKAYLDTVKAEENLTQTTKDLGLAKDNLTIATWDEKLAVAKSKGEYDEYKKSVVDAFDKGEISADEARMAIEKSMTEMSKAGQQTFMQDIPNAIKDGMEPSKYQTAGQKIKNWFGGIGDSIKRIWNTLFNDYSDATPKMAVGGIVVSKPKLASGGIINMPNKGVSLGGAIGGERGAEGVIPLTDSQAMETLGSAIGRYITLNAVIENKMDGKTINRALKQVNMNNDFVMNR